MIIFWIQEAECRIYRNFFTVNIISVSKLISQSYHNFNAIKIAFGKFSMT